MVLFSLALLALILFAPTPTLDKLLSVTGLQFVIPVLWLWLKRFARVFGIKGTSERYLTETHPDIWHAIHPINYFGFDRAKLWDFMKGRLDDGSDAKLNAIKSRWLYQLYFMAWSFGIVLLAMGGTAIR